ncbi:hypothetical protein LXL04_038444 [Taraxacum kok-saghyz]
MASSSSSVGNRMNRSRRHGLRSKCWCGDLVGKWTAYFHHNGNVELGDFGEQPLQFLPTPPLQQPLQQPV